MKFLDEVDVGLDNIGRGFYLANDLCVRHSCKKTGPLLQAVGIEVNEFSSANPIYHFIAMTMNSDGTGPMSQERLNAITYHSALKEAQYVFSRHREELIGTGGQP